MRRKQQRASTTIIIHTLIEKFRTLKIQPVHRLIEQKQRRPQRKSTDEKGFFAVAGGKFADRHVRIVFKMKACHKSIRFRQGYTISTGHKDKIFAEAEIAKGGILGKHRIARLLKRMIAEIRQGAAPGSTYNGIIRMQPTEYV